MSIIRPERCEKCKWAVPAQNSKMYNCRAHPPHATIAVGQGPGGQIVTQTFADFPPVQPDQWCGEFKANVMMTN